MGDKIFVGLMYTIMVCFDGLAVWYTVGLVKEGWSGWWLLATMIFLSGISPADYINVALGRKVNDE